MIIGLLYKTKSDLDEALVYQTSPNTYPRRSSARALSTRVRKLIRSITSFPYIVNSL